MENGIRQRLERVNLVLRTLRNVDHVVLEETDRKKLINGVCRSLVATRGYYNAWILLLDEDRKYEMTAESGLDGDFMILDEKLKREGLSKCGQRALDQPGPVVVSDPVTTCTDCPLSKGYQDRGGIASRLYYRDKLYGLLCASIPSSLVEEREECSLFEEIAQDVAFALHKISLEEEHERAQKNLRAYAEQAIVAQEEERRRIAWELHDETAQALASLGMDIGSLLKNRKVSQAQIGDNLQALRTKTEAILEGIRALSKALRPPMLEQFGLLAALRGLLKELETTQQTITRFDSQGNSQRLTPDIEITMYRIAQEALSNVRKYARASECHLVIKYSPRKVTLEIRDNGLGFVIPESAGNLVYSGKFGLAGMQERAQLIGGKLTIVSRPGKGTSVQLEVPAGYAGARRPKSEAAS